MNADSINDLLNSLKEEFLTTLPERLTEIESLLLSLPEDADVENLLRIVHSLKGAAGTHGFHIFTKICHQMEDMLRELIVSKKIHSQAAVKVLLDYNDLHNTALSIIRNDDDNFSTVDSKLNQLASASGNKQRKILVVEPSALYSSMIVSVIENVDFQVTVVNDGFSALEKLLMQYYDFVITAMETATLNGDALLSAVRLSQSKNKKIKAILITTKQADKIEHADLFNHILDRSAINKGELKKIISI